MIFCTCSTSVGMTVNAHPSIQVGEPCRVEVLGAVLTFTELGAEKESPPASFLASCVGGYDSASMPPTLFIAGTCMSAGKTSGLSFDSRVNAPRSQDCDDESHRGSIAARPWRWWTMVRFVTFTDVGFTHDRWRSVEYCQELPSALSSLPVDL